MMNESSNDSKDETKPVLGYPQAQSGHLHQHDPKFLQNYYPYQYPPFYYYPPNNNCQSNYYDTNNKDNTNNNNTTLQPQVSNVSNNTPPPKRKLFTFPRILCCLLFVIIVCVIVTIVVIWYYNYISTPQFQVQSLVIHSFEISNSSELTARWDIDVAVFNENKEAELRFEHVASSLMYKFALLETSFSAPFTIPKDGDDTFRAEFDIPNPSHQKMGGLKVFDMAKDREKNGKLYFDLKIEAKMFSKQSNKGSRSPKKTLYLYCEDIGLKFKDSSSLPEWDGEVIVCDDDE